MADHKAAPQPDANFMRMSAMVQAPWGTMLLYAAAKLAVADHLGRGPKSASELAALTGTDPPALQRLMRALVAAKIFACEADGRYKLTDLSEFLRSDHPFSLRAKALVTGDEPYYRAWGEIVYSLRTGKPALDHVFGMSFFDYYRAHPEEGGAFNQFMRDEARWRAPAILAAYDFSTIKSLVDVGGGYGALLAMILRSAPLIKAILFDLPEPVGRGQKALTEQGLADRCEFVSGDFFAAVPPGHDAYLLSWILHDWDDDAARRILLNCRQAIAPGGRLLVVETVIGPGNETFGAFCDVNMMLATGGRERSADQFRQLFKSAGFELKRIAPEGAMLSIVEGAPV